jgi:transmembrane protein 8A/B
MTVTRALLKILNSNMPFNDTLHTNATSPNGYKFFVPRDVDICTVTLTIAKACNECRDINFYVQARSLPTTKNYLHSAIINVSASSDDVIEFYPHENTWHYVDLKFLDHFNSSLNASTASTPSATTTTIQSVDYTITIEYQLKKTSNDEDTRDETVASADDVSKYIPLMPKSRNFEEYSLLRQTYREFFMYDYDLVPDANGSVPLAINLTSRAPALMRFDIGDVYDIGGTLTFAISMRTDVTTSSSEATVTQTTPSVHIDDLNGEPAIAEKLTNEIKFNNQTVIICIRLNEPGVPTYPDKCAYGRHTFPANTIINNTNEDTGTSVVHIPFPETGTW